VLAESPRSERKNEQTPTAQLLERNDELARIESALAEARAGRGRFVVVEGPAGIGKTVLLAAARTAARKSGMRVLRSSGTELERDFAFGVVRQLFEPALAEMSELERAEALQAGAGPTADLLGVSGDPAAASSDVDRSFAILHGLYWLCANLAATDPVCLVVDDAHWADAPSLRYLAFLLARLDELNVALVMATRPQEAGTDPALLATLTADASADVIRLPPLSGAAVGRLIERRLGAVPDPIFTATCLLATRGVPFLLRELLEALNDGQITPTAEAARHVERIGARTVGRSVRLRLRRLPEHAGRLARALSVLERGDLLQVSRLAGLDEAEASDAAALLVTAGILEPGRPLAFIHPIVRSGIYSDLTSAERSHGHRTAAELLAERAGGNERVARHLLGSEPAADGWVVERLVEEARAAVRNGAPESAARFLRRALAEPPPPDEQAALLLELGTAEAAAGLPECFEHLQSAVDAAPDPASAAGAANVLARALNRAERFAEAVDVLDRASASLDSRDGKLAGDLEAHAIMSGLNDPALARAMASRRDALREQAARDSAASPELVAVAAYISVLTNEPADVGAELATRALRAEEEPAKGLDRPPGFSSATFPRAILTLLLAERYAQVGPLLDAAISEARATGDGGRLAASLGSRGWLALRRGDPCAAEADARTALTAANLPAPAMYRAVNGGVLVKALVDQGKLDEAEQALAPLAPEVERGFVAPAILRLARGGLRAARGQFADALEDFLAVGAALTQAQVTTPAFLPWRSEAALAHLALGDHESAKRLSAEELELARAFGAPRALGVASRAAGLVAGGERGELLLREAIESFERAGASLERARALTDLGAMLRRRNRRRDARELLREALDTAHRAGARRLAEQAETELRATGARPRRAFLTGLDSLTASERRIAELAAAGQTNREIAQALFVTARTVEGHLTSVFRKLQLDSRSGLRAVLAPESP
jgi:DNA-binding CsgD family transcriptional regulator